MARKYQKKSLDNSSIVIVCEGTETENQYLKKLAEMLKGWHILSIQYVK
jgi:hypothetical protein